MRHVLLALIITGCGQAAPSSTVQQRPPPPYVPPTAGSDGMQGAPLVHPELRVLHASISAATGCTDVRFRILEYTATAITAVGAEACGRQFVYTRQLRRRF